MGKWGSGGSGMGAVCAKAEGFCRGMNEFVATIVPLDARSEASASTRTRPRRTMKGGAEAECESAREQESSATHG